MTVQVDTLRMAKPIITPTMACHIYKISFAPINQDDLLDFLSICLFPDVSPEENQTLISDIAMWDGQLEGCFHATTVEKNQLFKKQKLLLRSHMSQSLTN